jgi:hypothetical protein
LQKIESLGRCIAKIEILDVALKIAPNFGRYFSLLLNLEIQRQSN